MSSTAKKIIILVGSAAVLLAVLLIILFTCGGNNNPENPIDSDSESESIGGLPTPEDSESETEEPGDSTTDPVETPTEESDQTTEEPADGTTDTPNQSTETSGTTTPETNTSTPKPETNTNKPEDKPSEPSNVEVFDHKSDTIYITASNVYTRKAALVAEYTEYTIVHYRDSYERIASSQNWSCINIDGIYCYILNEYISTTEPPEIVDTPEDTEPPVDPDDPSINPDDPDNPGTPAVPGEFVEDNSVYYVQTWGVNVRYTPEVIGSFGDKENNVAGHFGYGDAIQAIASNGRWIRISFNKDGASYVCYVAITSSVDGSAILSKTPPTPIEPPTPEDTTNTPVVTEPSTETEEQPSK
ncbi:MAG: hypothetical protein IKA82_01705 [Clostridia bacterium]|nr:hypothetical protein [Clostridia bacterium]